MVFVNCVAADCAAVNIELKKPPFALFPIAGVAAGVGTSIVGVNGFERSSAYCVCESFEGILPRLPVRPRRWLSAEVETFEPGLPACSMGLGGVINVSGRGLLMTILRGAAFGVISLATSIPDPSLVSVFLEASLSDRFLPPYSPPSKLTALEDVFSEGVGDTSLDTLGEPFGPRFGDVPRLLGRNPASR